MLLLADGSGVSAGVVVAVILIVVLLLAVLCISALISILRAPMDPGLKVVWFVGCLVFQFVGPLLWFTLGRRVSTDGPLRLR